MNFNLEGYKKLRGKEVEYFLRGINFANINKKDTKIIEYASPECSTFFNEVGPSRFITEEFLLKVREYYSKLINTDLEFATSKEEVDIAVKEFVDKVRKELDEYKYTIIKQTFIDKKKIQGTHISMNKHKEYNVKEDNLINLGLNFMKIQIGDKVFAVPKTGREAEKEDVVLDNLNIMLVYVYVLIGMINDKKVKKDDLVDFNAMKFKVTDPRYLEIYDEILTSYLNIKSYEDFVTKYNALFEQIESGKTKQTMLNEISEMVNKYNEIPEDILFLIDKVCRSNNYQKIKTVYYGMLTLIDNINRGNDYEKIQSIYDEMKASFPELFPKEQNMEEEQVKPKARH